MAALEAARKDKGILDEEDMYKSFDPELFVDLQFKDFTIAELREHQQAILNMFNTFNFQNLSK